MCATHISTCLFLRVISWDKFSAQTHTDLVDGGKIWCCECSSCLVCVWLFIWHYTDKRRTIVRVPLCIHVRGLLQWRSIFTRESVDVTRCARMKTLPISQWHTHTHTHTHTTLKVISTVTHTQNLEECKCDALHQFNLCFGTLTKNRWQLQRGCLIRLCGSHCWWKLPFHMLIISTA